MHTHPGIETECIQLVHDYPNTNIHQFTDLYLAGKNNGTTRLPGGHPSVIQTDLLLYPHHNILMLVCRTDELQKERNALT